MVNEAKRIKEHYIRPPLIQTETYFVDRVPGRKKRGGSYEVEVYIWVTHHIPEYRVVIPENFSFDGNGNPLPDEPIDMRYVTYIPTGRVVYDNTRPKLEAVVFEYVLETMSGKKDLIHR